MKSNSYSSFPLEIKTFESNGIISGYASVFSVNDRHNDQIQYGAFYKQSYDQKLCMERI